MCVHFGNDSGRIKYVGQGTDEKNVSDTAIFQKSSGGKQMRTVVNFNTKWAFSKEAEQVPQTMPERWYWVNLPHTWNAIDGQDGGNDLYCLLCKRA